MPALVEALITTEGVLQLMVAPVALAVGGVVLPVTVAVAEAVQPVAVLVTVTIYIPPTVAIGFWMAELNPEGPAHA